MTREISNADDVIDSRDVLERIDALRESLFDKHQDEGGCDSEFEAYLSGQVALGNEEAEELKHLEALQEEAEGYAPDWKHGATLVRDSYFTDYCRELLEDIGDLPKDLPAYIVIDWDATAQNIRIDYTSVEFDGVTYWVR